MAKTILAVDPGSNKLGAAVFHDNKLISCGTSNIEESTPLTRRIEAVRCVYQTIELIKPDIFVSEEPLLMGRNNNGMQRLLGMFEFISDGSVQWIHPMTVKKAMGSGSLDKLEVALAVGELLTTEEEKEIVADAINREAWDETDAIAVGLTWMIKQKEQANA